MEQSPQPPQDILSEARSYQSLDAWLSTIPDERLQEVINIVTDTQREDFAGSTELAHLIGVAMYFKGNQPTHVAEIPRALQVLFTQITLEAQVRNGVLEKHGEYSMQPSARTARFTVTDRGREIHGQGGDREQ